MRTRTAYRWLLAPIGTIPLLCAAATGEPESRNATELADLSLEQLLEVPVQLVYSASKYEQKVTRAPASVSIVTSEEIRLYGYRTLADVLQSVRGLYVSDDRNYSYFGSRGFLRPGDYNSRVLVLMDGHRINDNIYDGAYIGREGNIDVDMIERVEFVRGPSSSIYGSSAFFGIIDIVTRHGEDTPGLTLSGSAASFDSYNGRVTYGTQLKNEVELSLTASYYTSHGADHLYYGEFDQRIATEPRATNDGFANGLDGEEACNSLLRASRGDFTLSAFVSSRTKHVPTASFGAIFNDPREKSLDARSYLDLKYEHAFDENLQLLGRTSYDRYAYDGDYPYNYAAAGDPPDEVIYKDKILGEWIGTEWQLTQRLFDRHTLIGGLEYRQNLRQEQLAYDDTDPRLNYVDDNRQERDAGLFAQGEFTLTPRWLLNAGLRYDHYFESFGGTLNPRAALIYTPREHTIFKALYGQAFRAPSAYERFYYDPINKAQDLDPERIRTYELTFDQYLGRHHRLNISVYHYDVYDLISQAIDDDKLYFDNLDRAHALGGEIEVEGKYDHGIQLRASFSLNSAEDMKTRERLSNSPRQLAKLNLGLPVRKLTAGMELQYQGAVRTLDGARERGFLLGNLTLSSRQVNLGTEVSASIFNLFDTAYSYAGAEDHLQDVIRQDGRSYQVKLTRRF